MSEYQIDNENSQSRHTSDKSISENQIQIEDNRSQFLSQKTVQKKLAQYKPVQSDNVLQREDGLEDDELPVQGKKNPIQLLKEDEELPIQGKSITIQKIGNQDEKAPNQERCVFGTEICQLESEATNTTGLPDKLKSGIENLSGISLDEVNVHYNSDKPAQLQALAYTQGTDIHVAPGQERHLAHEAWHVVQQMQGRVEPTITMNENIPVNDDASLENEADNMGEKAKNI